MEQKFDINDPKIYLRNGNVLHCFPLASNEPNNLNPSNDRQTWGSFEKIFSENVFLFLANADLIFSDSRMFLAQANVHSGMAYSGPFKQACLGAFLEWWIYFHRFSIDKKGRPIWFLSGSPLSGCHACRTVDENGQSHKADLQSSFITTCKSFVGTCKDYREAQQYCQAFTIEEVIEILKGKDSLASKARIHTMMEYFKMDNEIQSLRHEVEDWQKRYSSVTDRLQHLLFEKYHSELTEYHNKCLNLETIADLKKEYYKQQRIESRRELKAGRITPQQHQKHITPLRKEAEEAEREWSFFSRERLAEILGDDNGWLLPRTVDRLFIEQIKPSSNDTEIHS